MLSGLVGIPVLLGRGGFNVPTNIEILEYAFQKAKSEGLEYVYLGNIGSNKGTNTYCPECGILTIRRVRFSIVISNLDKNGKCIHCNHQICIR
ncbi:MAG: hypothetical protein GF317_19045 [Candidatus Lokiarchaeota archaeon]|nr:hypothetical protein [Candidatus Lokiarchaeota archaeon]MBD3201609.1 hypothetical protein [Candidatus Lokiarchaeota archaeon]